MFRIIASWDLYVCAWLLQPCPALCDLMDCSPAGSSAHGIFPARILEWVAIPFSRGSSWSRDESISLGSPELAGRFFITSATWEAHQKSLYIKIFFFFLIGTYGNSDLAWFLKLVYLCIDSHQVINGRPVYIIRAAIWVSPRKDRMRRLKNQSLKQLCNYYLLFSC